jgi:hypothetical protein
MGYVERILGEMKTEYGSAYRCVELWLMPRLWGASRYQMGRCFWAELSDNVCGQRTSNMSIPLSTMAGYLTEIQAR